MRAAPAPPERIDPVQLLTPGTDPRAPLRYQLTRGSTLVVRGELAMFQPVYRFDTTYSVEANGDGYTLATAIHFDTTKTMLGLFGPLAPTPPDCSAVLNVDSRGKLTVSSTDAQCTRTDQTLYGFRETPLRPAIPLSDAPVGVGARWRVAPSVTEPRANYTLLDVSDGVWTVWGELEPTRAARAETGAQAVPDAAWMLARLSSSQPVRSATVGWSPGVPKKSDRKIVPMPSPGHNKFTALIRLNVVAEGVTNARDETRAALERALGQRDEVRKAAIEASGITNEWRLVEPLLALRADEHVAPEVDRALALLTGRAARGPEDWIEASAPYVCRGDAAKAEAILTRGIDAGGSPEFVGKLLALRASLRSVGENVAAATDDYRDALAHSPADPEVVRVVAWWLSTAQDPAHRDGGRALSLLSSVSGNDGYLQLFAQAKAAALAEQGDFVEAKRIQEQAVETLTRAATMLGNAAGEQRTQAAQERAEAHARRAPWRLALTANESPLCYRFFGLSNTLL